MKRDLRTVEIRERLCRHQIDQEEQLAHELRGIEILIALSTRAISDAIRTHDPVGAMIHRAHKAEAEKKARATKLLLDRIAAARTEEIARLMAGYVADSAPRGNGAALPDRLANWGRWLRSPSQGTTATAIICESMEKWHAEKDDGGVPPPAPPEPVDEADAMLIERCMRPASGFDQGLREFFKEQYMHNQNRSGLCRMFGIRFKPSSVFDLFVARALREFGDILDIAENGHRIHRDNLIPGSDNFPRDAIKGKSSLPKTVHEEVD